MTGKRAPSYRIKERQALTQFARDIQEQAWTDLEIAFRQAIRGAWSMGAVSFAATIVRAARLVGPTPWENVPWTLVAGGVYGGLYATGGVTAAVPNDLELEGIASRLRRSSYGHSPTVQGSRQMWARVVAELPMNAADILAGLEGNNQ